MHILFSFLKVTDFLFWFIVPVAVFLFTLPLPYLGAPSALPPGFVAGGIILILGMLTYVWTPVWNAAKNNQPGLA